MNSDTPLQDLNLLKKRLTLTLQKNLSCLHAHFPNLHARFANYQPKEFWLDLDPRGFLNLRSQRGFLFDQDPKTTSDEQLNAHRSSPYRTLYQARSVDNAEQNKHGFVHLGLINQLIQKGEQLVAQRDSVPVKSDFYPSLFVIGNGLGFHLDALAQESLNHIHIFEPLEDFFFASLLAVDYSVLIEKFSTEGRHISIEVGSSPTQFINNLHYLIRELGQYRVGTLPIFNHYKSPDIEQALHLFFDAATQYYSGFGFFEDEILSVEHTIKNLAAGTKLLNANKKVEGLSQIPTFVCGNGPSLDLNIEHIKKYEKSCLIISCGSAIYPLYKAGIKPDIHFEIERTKDVASWISLIKDPSYFDGVALVASNNVAPDVLALFTDTYLFLKPDDMGTMFIQKLNSNLFENTMNLAGSNPLVGNGALAFLLEAGFENLYLVGLDVGYRKLEHHHSKDSAYYTEFDGEFAGTKTEEKKVPGNFGGQVYTEVVYDYSRHVLEWSLARQEYKQAKCFNCSDGAHIQGASPLHLEEFDYAPQRAKPNVAATLTAMADHNLVANHQMLRVLKSAEQELFRLIDELFIELPVPERPDMAHLCSVFQWQFEKIKSNNKDLAGLILQNSINQFQTIVLGQLHQMKSEEAREQYIKEVYRFMADYFTEMKSIFEVRLFRALA